MNNIENIIVKEQRQTAYRCFLNNAQQVLQALNKGILLSELAYSCEPVCCHTCTDGYESKICNVHNWIYVLIEIDQSCLLQTRINVFLEYVLLQHKDHLSLCEKAKILFSSNIFFCNYEHAKGNIIEFLSSGHSITNLVNNFDSLFSSNEDSSYIRSWVLILQQVDIARIIPGNDLLEFLKFI